MSIKRYRLPIYSIRLRMTGGEMKITKIKIENIRGIASREISCQLHPNKPSIFVAPNGFGKTSFATGFNSLKRDKIELEDDNLHNANRTNSPVLEITDDLGNTYIANSTSNSIAQEFSISVITSRIKSNATSRNLGGFTATSSSIIVKQIVLYEKIPNKVEFTYSFQSTKNLFNCNAKKLLINLKSLLSNDNFKLKFIAFKDNFKKLSQQRNSKKIKDWLDGIENLRGSRQDILSEIDLGPILQLQDISDIYDGIVTFFSDSREQIIFNILQLLEVFHANNDNFEKIKKYTQYCIDKERINQLLKFFNCTWKNISASKSNSKLVIDFPKANQISNGERDVLCFIGNLFESRSRLARKNKSILIIDEIFDYLDDANLIAAQYFLTRVIEDYKNEGKEIFPIILTHLDPNFFNTFNFSSKNVVYLDKINSITNKFKINNILKERANCKKDTPEIYNDISSNFLHYSTKVSDQSEYLSRLGAERQLHRSDSFRNVALAELAAYKNALSYDVALVSCGLRLLIEKKAFEQLDEPSKYQFLKINKTTDKLEFAKYNNANVPEVHFLLSIIYNEAMHLDQQCNKLHPIGYKLKNRVIRHMIEEVIG